MDRESLECLLVTVQSTVYEPDEEVMQMIESRKLMCGELYPEALSAIYGLVAEGKYPGYNPTATCAHVYKMWLRTVNDHAEYVKRLLAAAAESGCIPNVMARLNVACTAPPPSSITISSHFGSQAIKPVTAGVSLPRAARGLVEDAARSLGLPFRPDPIAASRDVEETARELQPDQLPLAHATFTVFFSALQYVATSPKIGRGVGQAFSLVGPR